jgi:two-component system sensor kinase FixL
MNIVSPDAPLQLRGALRSLADITRYPLLRNGLALCLFEASLYVAYRYGMSFNPAASAPFWFPDAVLLCALLQIRARWWWLPLIAALPIRLSVAIPPETPLWFLLSTAAIDSAKAMLSAALLRRWLADPFRFASVRDFGIFCLVAGLLAPGLSAFGGAAARHALGNPYWASWEQWFSGDLLAALVLTPILFYWIMRPPVAASMSRVRWLEVAVLATGALVSISLAFEPRPERLGFVDPRFYIPIMFLMWAALRFGMQGASAAAAALSCLAVAAALSGTGPFAHHSPHDTAAALQEFLLLRVAPLYLVAVLIDQTRRAEQLLRESGHSLRESEQRFRQMADLAPALIWMAAADGHCEFQNKGLLDFTGRTGAGGEGDLWVSSIHSDDRERCLAAYRASFAARRPYEMEYRMLRYDGADRWMLDRGVPRYTPHGEFLGYIGCAIDVTDRRANEIALKESEERYRAVVESQTDLVCRFLSDTTLTFVNEAYCRQLSREREDLLGTKLLEQLSARTRDAALGCVEQAALAGKPTTWECEVTLPDGTQGWQLWVCHAIAGRDAAAQEFQAIGHDITDRKRAEEARRSLAHTARLAAVGEFTAMVAHEISQPLCAILGNAEAAEQLLLADNPPLAELRDIVVDIRDADLRADEAIRSIRALTQKREVQVGPLDLNAVVTDILRLIAGDALYRRVHVIRELAADMPLVFGDRASVEQVLLNLLSNGMDAMRDTPETERQLTVQTRRKGTDYAEVTVVDCGPGIAPEQMKHLFESFFTTKPQGVGLGLSIARSIVQMHQGRIWADNCADGGAAFHFTLRCAQ